VRFTAATVLCLALLSTASCGSDAEPSAPPTPADSVGATSAAPREDTATETATHSATEDATGAPELPDEAREQTEAGAEAFVEHYFETLNALGEEPKSSVLSAYEAPSCSACSVFSGTIEDLSEQGRSASGPFVEAQVTRMTVVEDTAGADVELRQLGPDIMNSEGDTVEEGAGEVDGSLLMELVWFDNAWMIAEISAQAS
jgi:hypothetical protein